ncbi:hypothetical protein [Streptomyces brevispora]|uniref:hypothetical protein n=1 Tax=Streptomyces brevispora TaxID=887462 RepID=UPI0035DD04C5
MTDRNRAVLSGLAGIRSDLEDLYRDLHRYPELGLREHRTAKKASDALRDLGYEVTDGIGGTGVIGVLANSEGVALVSDRRSLPTRCFRPAPGRSSRVEPAVRPSRRGAITSLLDT